MYSKIGVVEVGSTNTKAYSINDGKIVELGFKTIEIKKNYQVNRCVSIGDIESLASFIKKAFSNQEKVYVYATSIFRELSNKESESVIDLLCKKVEIAEFNIVSAEQENKYTVLGSISGFKYSENICVFVGGGGSTEISICNNGRIVEMKNSKFGVSDIMRQYPELSEDVTNLDLDDISEFARERLQLPEEKADMMILSGGDFLLRYRNAGYPAQENKYFKSSIHPLSISYLDNRKFEDNYYHNISLETLKETTPDNPKWWNGTRAMCAVTNAVAVSVGATILIPTRISMIYGIAAMLLNK